MPRLPSLALLLVLSSALLGGTCSEPEAVPLEELQKDVAPAFAYSLYCDEDGTLVGDCSAVLLVYRAAHLERIYADSLAGNPRAQALFGQLENTVRLTGTQLAKQSQGIACHSLPACVVRWHKLDEFMPSRGVGGTRLRQMMADSFAREARLQNVSNAATAAVLDVLLVGAVLRRGVAGTTEAAAAEARTAAVEATAGSVEAGRLAVAGLEARLTAEELAALEVRIAEEEALATAARHPRRLEALARHRPSSSQPPQAWRPSTRAGPATWPTGTGATRSWLARALFLPECSKPSPLSPGTATRPCSANFSAHWSFSVQSRDGSNSPARRSGCPG